MRAVYDRAHSADNGGLKNPLKCVELHLRSSDFLDVDKYPIISFQGNEIEVIGHNDYIVSGELTI